MDGIARVEQWFAQEGWSPFAFQREVWQAYLDGEHGLIHSATGTGKTLAAWMGLLAESPPEPGLKALWITPLRALAGDTLDSLMRPIEGLGMPWRVELRTGDTGSSVKARQLGRMPDALVTTPESLSLLLSREEWASLFAGLRLVVVDEWHELMASKRGVLTELALARVRAQCPQARVWGLSATLGNLEEAMACLLGPATPGRLVKGVSDKEIVIDSIIPDNLRRLPWAGHFGVRMIPEVVKALESGGTTLVFTNTRSQAELWHQEIIRLRPNWHRSVALHHGSLDREERERVEEGLKEGILRAVVCTSSLDLGVDFTPVERVLQVGSPKGVARLLQRAGRSGHRPGVPSRVTCVPTHAFELVDMASARRAGLEGKIEGREPVVGPLDVLAQHLVTVACGAGFVANEMLAEVRRTMSYRDLRDDDWRWVLDFITQGGPSLTAYPEYRRVSAPADPDGLYQVTEPTITRRHRLSIGTIPSDAQMHVQLMKGGRLGTVEESFASRLKPGDRFIFAGRALQFVRIKDMTVWVSPSRSVAGAIPRWAGGRLPLSTELSHAIRETLARARDGWVEDPEVAALAPILEIQAEWSRIPHQGEFLIESVETREGHHLFFFPFEGRLVHEGLAALLALRLGRIRPITFTMACNDYGFELLSPTPAPLEEALEWGLLDASTAARDIPESLNSVEMARRQFRDIARIAGLIFPGTPGTAKTAKQVQVSSNLFFDVFSRYEPENRFLAQAHQEVLERQMEESRLTRTLQRVSRAEIVIERPPRPTPLAFPILVDRLRDTLTTETIEERLVSMGLLGRDEIAGASGRA